MTHMKVNYHDIDPRHDAMHFLRDHLGCEQLGVTIVDCDPGWTGPEHEHREKDHEEVYVLVEGEATVMVDDEEVPLISGDVIRIAPESTRQIQNGETHSTFVLAGAP